MMNRRRFLAAMPLLAAAMAARAQGQETDKAVPAARLLKPADGRPLDKLLIRGEAGSLLPIGDFSGKLLIINLWAPWCVPCRREMPSLSRLQTQLDGRSAALLPVAFDWRGAEGVRRFYEEIQVSNLPVLSGEGENMLAVTGMSHLPLTLISDKAGKWTGTVEGEASWDDAETLAWIAGLAAA